MMGESMEDTNKKQMTLDDLAAMVADGFGDLGGRMDKLDGRMEGVEGRMDKIEGRMDTLGKEMAGLCSSVNNYLELSDKRYFELKHRDALIAQWVKAVAEKTGVPMDLGELEKIN